jgi:hypothetical protein
VTVSKLVFSWALFRRRCPNLLRVLSTVLPLLRALSRSSLSHFSVIA